MTSRIAHKFDCVRTIFLGTAGMLAASALVSLPRILAQSARAATPKWEVISIKPCDPKSGGGGVSGSPGRLTVPCASVRNLIDWAYSSFANGLHFDPRSSVPIEGAPAWIDSDFRATSDRYTINAKAEGDPNILTMLAGPMMQALLEDRFKLKMHRATREVAVYALTVAKGGPKLQPFQDGSCFDTEDTLDHPLPPPEPGKPRAKNCRQFVRADKGLDVYGTTMREFCASFKPGLDRPVIDRTGIAGVFSLHLDLSLKNLGVPGDVVSNATGQRQSTRPTLDDPADRFDAVRTALRKIGLNLKATKRTEILVIDHVERPSEN